MNRSKKQQTAPQIAKLRRKAFPPMEKNAKPSQIVPNSILCSSPSHTRGVNSLSPRSSRPLLSHRFSAHPPAQQLSPHKGLAEATQAEKKKGKVAARAKETEPGPRATPASAISAASETSREPNSAGEHRAASRSGHPMPSSADLRAQQQRGSRYTP